MPCDKRYYIGKDMHFLLVGLMALFSGITVLASETLWNRVLADVIGATNFATTLVLVIFFVAFSLGSAYIRRWPLISRSPWLAFSLLQRGIAVTLLPTLILSSFDIYPASGILSQGWIITIQLIIAIFLIGGPSFLMGGTLLALTEASCGMGPKRRVSFLYGLNMLGAVIGIIAATFCIIYRFGIKQSLILCMVLSLGIAFLSRGFHIRWKDRLIQASPKRRDIPPAVPVKDVTIPSWLYIAATTSGFIIMGFEILLLHAYAQVGQNSSWSFGAMLAIVITTLGIAAIFASMGNFSRTKALVYILPISALFLAIFPMAFYLITKGLVSIFKTSDTLESYMVHLLRIGFFTGGPFILLSGLIFPWTLDVAAYLNKERISLPVGRMFAFNALGAVAGVVGVQWILMPRFGIWRSYFVIAAVPLLVATLLQSKIPISSRPIRWSSRMLLLITFISLSLIALLFQNLPQVRLLQGEEMIETRSGPEGVVSVCRGKDNLWRINSNNNYILSDNRSIATDQRLGLIPLLMHPSPKRVVYLGMGTGLTASAGITSKRTESIKVIEISPLIIELSLKHFGQFTDYFQKDPRVNILEADGVYYFGVTSDKFDVVIGDLFLPWRRGVTRLYSLEHFTHVRDRLNPGGIFCQWLPLHQLNKEAVFIIATTFKKVFPEGVLIQVALEDMKFVGLLGRNDMLPIGGTEDKAVWAKRQSEEYPKDPLMRDPAFVNTVVLGKLKEIYPRTEPIHTLNRPILEPFVIRSGEALVEGREYRE